MRVISWFSCGAASAVATKLALAKYGEDVVSKRDGKQAIQLLIDSGRCVYTYFGGSFVELAPKE